MPFSARALKKNIFFDVDIVVKKTNWNVVYRRLYSNRLTSMCDYSFPKHFFVLFLHIKRVCKSFWKESLTQYKQLICIMHRAPFQVRVGKFSVVKTNIYFAIFDIVVKNKSNVV